MDSEDVFNAVRRGYNKLQDASSDEICSYFSNLEQKELIGHINNIKGILFEQEIAETLNNQGVSASLFELTNHPDSDLMIMDGNDIIGEFQLKATDSVSYINDTLDKNPDIPIITTHEVAQNFNDTSLVIDSGINNDVLTDCVTSIVSDNNSVISDMANDVANDYLSESVEDCIMDNLLDGLCSIPISPLGLFLSII